METKFFALDHRLEALRDKRHAAPAAIVADFDDKLDVSWIYHDSALEGVVLSYSELKAAIDKKIISDVTLIPSYEEIKNHKAAIEWVRQFAAQIAQAKKKKGTITADTLKQLYALVTPEEVAKGLPYRKDNPLHRLYFHEISPPAQIAARMKKLVEWLDEEETQHLHPVDRAARAHYRFMSIYPYPKNSGKTARLFMNLLLLRDGYPPAIIHSIDRQRYYDVLRAENAGLIPMTLEALENSIEPAIQFFDELEEAKRKAAAEQAEREQAERAAARAERDRPSRKRKAS